MDWRKTLPTIAALATGNIPGAIGAAAIAVSDALGFSVPATPDAVNEAISGATPEQLVALRKVDADLKVQMRAFDVEEKRIGADSEKALLADTANARQFHSENSAVLKLGFLINAASYVCVAGVLMGCFSLLGSKVELKVDAGTAAMVGSIVGAAVQWLLQNAHQANGFFFGSSPSSRAALSELSASVGRATGAVAAPKKD